MISLNYIGSKKTLKNTIFKVCKDNINNIFEYSFADLFAGTGIVGFNINITENFCKNVLSNDLEYYSYIINCALLKSIYSEKINKIIEDLNKITDLKEGLIYKNFSNHQNCERMFFTNKNAKKCDTIRIEINRLLKENIINENEFNFLLASLIVSIDKCANTSSVYGAYLKKFKKTALKEFVLKPIHINIKLNDENKVFNKKIEDLVKENEFDIVYLDPPYNQRQYGGNYSPLNYIAKYDENIELKGKTGLIKDYNKSAFCSKVKIKKTFKNLIKDINCKYLLLSYNNEGLLSEKELKDTLLEKGDLKLYKIEYSKFKAQMKVKESKTIEYLWFIKVNDNTNKSYEEVIMKLIK